MERRREFTDLMEEPRPAPPTILTPEPTPAVLPLTVLTGVKALPRHTTHTRVPTQRLIKVRMHTARGDNRSYPTATNRPTPNITPMPTAPSQRPKAQTVE